MQALMHMLTRWIDREHARKADKRRLAQAIGTQALEVRIWALAHRLP
jgi:hypothetical protein